MLMYNVLSDFQERVQPDWGSLLLKIALAKKSRKKKFEPQKTCSNGVPRVSINKKRYVRK
jgi:hypothetical protein